MPTRISAPRATALQPSQKTLSDASMSQQKGASQAVLTEEGPPTTMQTKICDIFSDAQKTTANHRKLIVGMRKIHEACVYEPTAFTRGIGIDDAGEEDFNAVFMQCVIRLMVIKRTESVGDKSLRFIGAFLRHASDKDALISPVAEFDDTQAFPETPSSRLISRLLSTIMQLLICKEKTVRYRSTQLISHVINSLDSIDDEYYHLIKIGLLKRLRDKEPMVRAQAVLGLGRLAGNEEDSERDHEVSDDDESSSGLLGKLLDVLQNDPSADVRRSLLINLPLTPGTLPFLLERARDSDAPTRRVLYSRLLPALGDFRHLSLSMREKLLRWGLRDRDDNVRRATARLFRDRWIEDCAHSRVSEEEDSSNELSAPSIDSLLELMERIDVVNSGGENGVAAIAMKEFWEGRPDYQAAVDLDDPFWNELGPESAFVARTFNDYRRIEDGARNTSLAEDIMPEVTKFAFILQRYINALMDTLRHNAARNPGQQLHDSVEQEFTVEQLLHIAKTLDYSDEVGRRKMFALLREVLAIPELPEECTKLVVAILRDMCGDESTGEREFCSVVLEAVAEVHDVIAGAEPAANIDDETFHSARSELSNGSVSQHAPEKVVGENSISVSGDEEQAIREITINMKCLHIAQCMLQNVECSLQENVHIVTMLNNLIVPAVRSHEAPIRERGLLCLGLCCLLDRKLADENLTLFLHCFSKGHEALQVTALQILTDILTAHPSILTSQTADPSLEKQISKLFSRGLKAQRSPEVQTAATIALCKLMLTSIITNEELLKQLVIMYFDASSRENAGMRQALTYFLPVYCHSRKEHMARMASVAGAILHAVVDMVDELGEDEDMVSISTVGNMLVDWTDARKLIVPNETALNWTEVGREGHKDVNGDIHLMMAESFLDRALGHSCSKEDKKALIPLLGKLYITPDSDAEKLHKVNELVVAALDNRIATEASSRTALNKLHLAVSKALGENVNDRSARPGEISIAPTIVDPKETESVQCPVEGFRMIDGTDNANMSKDFGKGMVGPSSDSVLDTSMDDEEEI